MPQTEGSASMFETVKGHEEVLQDHEDRLKKLEDQSLKLENTILTENRDTRKTMKEQTEKLFHIVENAMGYQTSRTTQDHELKMLKWKTLADVIFKVCGAAGALGASGGVIYMVVQHFLSN